jgi:hypothetical protein
MIRYSRRAVCWRACLVIAAAALLLLIVYAKRGSVFRSASVDIYINTNGLPTILGISLGRGAVRDITLRILRWAKVPVRVLVPSGNKPAWHASSDTNYPQTMDAIDKAGLIPTNRPSGPSPYE